MLINVCTKNFTFFNFVKLYHSLIFVWTIDTTEEGEQKNFIKNAIETVSVDVLSNREWGKDRQEIENTKQIVAALNRRFGGSCKTAALKQGVMSSRAKYVCAC